MFWEATREYRRSARCSKPTTKSPNSTSHMHAGWDSESRSGDHRSPKRFLFVSRAHVLQRRRQQGDDCQKNPIKK
ncbi:hypothetical protein KSP40_PGU002471 [Platanthera guangdongensis]|uniref:Uncharacterized protein n=1 Tax=Platanthera guangdongensis TaxID=2320717 RepID=A0ABR2MM83_9ASPA